MEDFGKLSYVFVLYVITTIISGFAFMKLWGWFITYSFSIKEVGFVEAVGLAFIINYLKTKQFSKNDGGDDMEELTEKFIKYLIYILITLGVGWFITLFQ